MAQRLQAEVDEVRSADELERDEHRFRGDEQRGQADARRDRPARLAGGDARRSPDAGGPSAEHRVPDRQRRVLAGGDDDEDRDSQKRSELAHGERLTEPAAALRLRACVLAEQPRGLDEVVRLERRHLFAVELLERAALEPGEPERLPVQRLLEDRPRVAGVPEPLAARRAGEDPLQGVLGADSKLVFVLRARACA